MLKDPPAWKCLPGDPENIIECAPLDDDEREKLYTHPPDEWISSNRPDGKDRYHLTVC